MRSTSWFRELCSAAVGVGAIGAIHFACASECNDTVPIDDGEYAAGANAPGALAGAALSIEGDVVTIEYRDGGVTYLVELRRSLPP